MNGPGVMSLRRFMLQTCAVADVELRKLLRDPTELFSRAVQPVLWLSVFGQVMERVRGIHAGPVSYLVFITPGILAQSVLFSAIFYGIAVIWERDLGVVHKQLVSPAYRSALIAGKALSAGFRGLVQAGVIYVLALSMHVEIRLDLPAVLAVLGTVMLGSAVFSTFSLIIACIVKTRERFMGVGQVLTMPLFFASSAIYPLELMPPWLQAIARINPLTYLVDALRGSMLPGSPAPGAWGVGRRRRGPSHRLRPTYGRGGEALSRPGALSFGAWQPASAARSILDLSQEPASCRS